MLTYILWTTDFVSVKMNKGGQSRGCNKSWQTNNLQPGPCFASNLTLKSDSDSVHRSAVLRTIRALNPKIVTIVEQTTNQSSPFFLSRFYEALHYYTTMFESIGDSMPEDSNERRIFEQQVLGKAIVNVVACEGQERTERQEPLDQWERRVRTAGFVASPITQVVMQTVYALLKTWVGSRWVGWGGYGALHSSSCLNWGPALLWERGKVYFACSFPFFCFGSNLFF